MINTVTYSKLGNNGRLGNQLFQIAATIAYAKANNMTYVFPEWEYSKYMKAALPTGKLPHAYKHEHPDWPYSPIPSFEGDVDLYYGYYQSPRYFEHKWHHISRYFTPHQAVCFEIASSFPELVVSKCCSIHVRRTDYLKGGHPSYPQLYALPLNYYHQAIDALYPETPLEHTHFFVCSDDIPWCRQNLKLPRVTFVEGQEPIMDLMLMSMCHNNIIANSSFSWWSAWLNTNPYKKVVAPSKWFANDLVDTKDIYCKDWIKVEPI